MVGTSNELRDLPHHLYRLFNSEGELLYVGITTDLYRRWKEHAYDKRWFHEVTSATYERYPDGVSCYYAERAAIIAEKPRHARDPRTIRRGPNRDPFEQIREQQHRRAEFMAWRSQRPAVTGDTIRWLIAHATERPRSVTLRAAS